MIKTHTEYSYRDFKHNILYKMNLENFNNLVESFVYRCNSNRGLLEAKFGEKYINDLIQVKLPKIIRTDAWRKERYAFDMWHIYIMANWPPRDIYSLQQSLEGNFHWRTDWEDETALYYNDHAYIGEY